MKTTLKNLSESEIEVLCEIPVETFEKERVRAVKRVSEEVSLPGFRKGHVPEDMLVKKFGEAFILEEMANLAIEKAYPEVLREHKIHAISMPQVNVKKLAKGNPFEVAFTFSVLPEITLPDYKKIASEIMKVEEGTKATEEEVLQATKDLLKQFSTKNDAGEEIVPELTLDIAQKFGPFATIEEFQAKLRESLDQDKEGRARSKKRMQAMEKIADEIKVKLPQILIDGELDRMMHQFRQDITQMGMKFEDYLATTKKTEEELRKEWVTDAEKRSKIQIALGKIAHAEKLEVPKEELDREVDFFVQQYKDIDRSRATMHLEMMLMNEKVFQFLESQK